MMYVEIWMGGSKNPAYSFIALEMKESIDGTFVMFKTAEEETIEVSPKNVIIQHLGKKKENTTTVANPDTPTETDFKYFTAEQVKNMSQKEVKENYSDIIKSMKKW
jgi:hypothetical protein